MARHSIEHNPKKLLLSVLKVGCLGIGSGANLVLLREYFVTRSAFCSLKEFQNAYGIIWLLPGPIASRLVAYLSYRTYPKWWIIPVALFLFSLPGFILCALFFEAQQFLPRDLLNHVTFFVSLSFMYVFCLSASRGHLTEYPTLLRPTLGVIGLSLALAVWLKPTLIQAIVIFVAGFGVIRLLIWMLTSFRSFRPHSIVFDPLLWITLIKASFFLYGGVYAAIPYLYDQWVIHHQFFTPTLYWQAVAIGQLTPGPMMNFIGYLGIAGGSLWHGYLMMMAYITLPCLPMILIAKLEDKILHHPAILHFFQLLFPFIITQIFFFALKLTYEQSQSTSVIAVFIGMALWKEWRKTRFAPFLALSTLLGLLSYWAGVKIS